jgi:hypothetical protein
LFQNASGLNGEDRAGLDRVSVEVDRAGPTIGGVASDVGAGQPKLVAQRVDQQQPWLDLELVLNAVDVQTHVDGAAHSLSSVCQRYSGTILLAWSAPPRVHGIT